MQRAEGWLRVLETCSTVLDQSNQIDRDRLAGVEKDPLDGGRLAEVLETSVLDH